MGKNKLYAITYDRLEVLPNGNVVGYTPGCGCCVNEEVIYSKEELNKIADEFLYIGYELKTHVCGLPYL